VNTVKNKIRITGLPDVEIDAPPMTIGQGTREKAVVENIALWCVKNIKLANWSAGEYEKNFGTRTPRQIISSKESGFVGSCLDMTLAANVLLREAGLDTKLVVAEIDDKRLGLRRLHFAMEFAIEGAKHHLDFMNYSRVFFAKGPYLKHRERDTEVLSEQRFDGEKIGLDDLPFKALFGVASADELAGKMDYYGPDDFHMGIGKIRGDRGKISTLFRQRRGLHATLIKENI
jgi:hypothetical protein